MSERFNFSSIAPEDHSETITAMDSEEVLLLAFEHFGIIKPLGELAQPIDRIMNNKGASDDLTERRENSLLAGIHDGESDRSLVQQKITEMLNRRRVYTEEQVQDLWADCKKYTARQGIPPVLEFINDFRHAQGSGEGSLPRLTEEAADLAPDVYWMMLFEEEKPEKLAAEPAA